MTVKGPRPTPRNLRLIRGMKDQTRHKPARPIVEPEVKIPQPPDYLTADETDVFVVTARKLAGMRLMTESDVDAIVVYARNWVDAQTARRALGSSSMLVRSPNGYPIINPHLAIARKAEDRCLRIMAEFGLTPSSRNRVSEP